MRYRVFWMSIAFIFGLFWSVGASAQVGECEPTDDGDAVVCPTERFQLYRDKGRVGQILCEALDTGRLSATLPSRLQAVCESADLTSRIWAKAQTWQEHRDAAQEAQRAANVAKGQLSESRRARSQQIERIKRLGEELAVARERKKRWRIVAVSAGGIAAISSVVLTGDIAGWWDL